MLRCAHWQLPTFQDSTSVPSWHLKMGPIDSRNVVNHQSTLRNIPEERRSHLHRDGSPKSRLQNTWRVGNFMVSPYTRRSHAYVQCLSPSDRKLEKVFARPCFYPILPKNIIPKVSYLPKRFTVALVQVTIVSAERQNSVLL